MLPSMDRHAYNTLASVPALSCWCMTYAYLNCYVSLVFYRYSYMTTYSLLWYLKSTMATCSLPWLPSVYYDYLQSTMDTCSLIWLPVVYYCYL